MNWLCIPNKMGTHTPHRYRWWHIFLGHRMIAQWVNEDGVLMTQIRLFRWEREEPQPPTTGQAPVAGQGG